MEEGRKEGRGRSVGRSVVVVVVVDPSRKVGQLNIGLD